MDLKLRKLNLLGRDLFLKNLTINALEGVEVTNGCIFGSLNSV
jgi:hypothetical protein